MKSAAFYAMTAAAFAIAAGALVPVTARAESRIKPKAHCLNYITRDVFPKWVKGSVESEKEITERRFAELARRYARRIPMWEVTNETFFKDKCKYELSSFFGAPDFIEWNYKTAAKYFASNRLVINEANPNIMVNYKGSGSAYYKLIKDALGKGCRIDGIGMQSHWLWKLGDRSFARRVKTLYDPQFTFELFDAYAVLGKHLQITEITIPAFSNDLGDDAAFVPVALDARCRAEVEVSIPANGNIRVYAKSL